MELSLNAIMYDNSLERPKGCKESGGEKTSYPGLDIIIKKLDGATRINNTAIKYNGKTFVFRYNAKGNWAFGGYSEADIVFAISRKGDDSYAYVVKTPPASKEEKGSWSLCQDDYDKAITETEYELNRAVSEKLKMSATVETGKNDG